MTDKPFLFFAILVTAAGFVLRDQFFVLSDDVAWLAYIAARMTAGGVLYLDLFEENLPLIFYLTLPAVWIGGLGNLPAQTSLLAGFHILVLASYAMSARSLEPVGISMSESRLIKALFLYLMLVQPAVDFGQREHLMVLLATPFLLLSGRKLDGGRVGTFKSLTAAVLAGIGVALKPHFSVAFAVLALVVLVLHGRKARGVLAEWLVVFLLTALHALSVLVVHPEYVQIVMPVIVQFYNLAGDAERTLDVLALSPALLVILAVFCAWGAVARTSFAHLFAGAEKQLLAAAVIFAFLFILQGKGLPFQFLPAILWGYLLGGLIVARICLADTGLGAWSHRAWLAAAVALPFMLSWPVGFHSVWPSLAEFRSRPLTAFATENFKGKPFLILTPYWSSTFPLALYAEVIWASRYPSLWMLPPPIVRRAGGEVRPDPGPRQHRHRHGPLSPERRAGRPAGHTGAWRQNRGGA